MKGAKTTSGGRHGEADEGPLRLCAVSRAQRPLDDLIRFVLGPDGAIVPDLARRLPGRGVWVGATRETVQAAVRQKVFARSLKQPVNAPDDLAELIDRLMAQRLAEAISLANKAGLLTTGFAKVDQLIGRGKAVVLIHAADAANDGAGKLDRKFKGLLGPERAPEATVCYLTGLELDLAIGRSNVVHAAASEGGASRRILQEAGRLRRYRSAGQTEGAVLQRAFGADTGRA